MTDVEFLERLQRELTESPAWSDVRGVVAPGDDPGLAGNELLVFPAVTEPERDQVSRFRVVVEWEVGPDRSFPQHKRASELDRLESVVALAAELHGLMLTDPRGDDAHWPEGYRFHAFGGFPGWWCYVALCGDLFSRLSIEPDDWIEAVDACAADIWDETCRQRGPIGRGRLEGLLKSTIGEPASQAEQQL